MAGIIVKDRDGSDVTHSGATGVRVRTLDGGTKDFIDGDTVPDPVETTVELDFSLGDMEVTPEDDKVFEKVTISQPNALIPENIADGVDIAGIIGTLMAGGSAKVSCGIITTSNTNISIQHGLGMIPEIIVVCPYGYQTVSNNYNYCFIGFKESFASENGILRQIRISTGASKVFQSTASNYAIDKNTDNGFIFGVTTDIFKISGYNILQNIKLLWFAIGGLT